MRKFPLKFLPVVLALLFLGSSVQVSGALTASGSKRNATRAVVNTNKKKTGTRKHRVTKKRKSSRRKSGNRKPEAITVLREYLPEIADIHETKAKGKGFSYIPVPVTFDSRSPFADPFLRYDLVRNIDKWLGTRYRFGGATSRGVDCSGFTSAVISATLGTTFAGSSHVQAARFTPIFSMDSLQFGDMVFFTGRNRKSNRIGHVGVYLGNGVFAHSSTGRGVIYSHISEGYYTERFRWGGRFIAGRPNPIQTANVYSN